jgi:HSP20 family protein
MATQTPKAKTKAEGGEAPARWDPFRELEPFGRLRLGRPLSGLLEDFFGERAARSGRWLPAVDVHESDAAYTLSVELPGAKREDLEVDLHEGQLTIRGEKRSEREEKKERSHVTERSYGSFSRTFGLPADAAADRIQAKFEGGVLTIEIPKSQEAKPKQVAIR